MSLVGKDERVTAVEIGTDTIKACMGTVSGEAVTGILGYEEISSKDCVRKGEVVSSNAVLDQLEDVLNQLEASTKQEVSNVYLAVTGGHFKTENVIGTIPITSESREITDVEIAEAVRNARNWSAPPEHSWVSSNSRMFVIDDKHRVRDPRGMIGSRLTSEVHVVYCNLNRLETVLRMVASVLGENVQDIEFSALASNYGLAPAETDDRGILCVDIGKGITDYSLFFEKECLHSGQLTVGCDHIANDLALGLHLPLDLCRALMVQHGSAMMHTASARQLVPIPDHRDTGRRAPEGSIHRIIELRLQEIFEIIRSDLDEHGVRGMIGGGVAIGGGAGIFPRITDLAQSVFKVPARVGVPMEVPGMHKEWLTPRHLTVFGLLYAAQRKNQVPDSRTPMFELVGREVKKIAELLGRAMRF